ncbi:S-layer homology domain-containing protein [Phascolarctobacterium sp.]|uniref:S-layer homology domain-containing protein n=1 Tax=Phascolarctobacterium sp. TaxID=2049039 RepID=UPI002A7F76BE|nr:S-layer homology domain-containing protein [Phascolarctobacterium sp.]MDY5044347.1 S-layer homology domain-containing protein [Phascolarctobacterium sp.]
MKKSLVLAMAMALGVTASAYAANPFSDVPAGHWAYDSISKLAAAGVIEGYGDTTFGGDKLMTRYEMAQIVAKAMAKGANVDKLAAEFADELDNLGVRVANLEKKADNVKITGEIRAHYEDYKDTKDKDNSTLRTRIWITGQVNDDWSYTGMIQNQQKITVAGNSSNTGEETTEFQRAFINGKIGGVKVEAGRNNASILGGEILSNRADRVKVTYGKDIKLAAEYGKLSHKEKEYLAEKYAAVSLSGKLGPVGLEAVYVDENEDQGLGKDNDIWAIAANYALTKDLGLKAAYLKGDVENAKGEDDGWYAILNYKGAKAAKVGSWGVYAGYYDLAASTYIANGWNTSYANDLRKEGGYEGFKVGANYAVAKNMLATVEYVDLEGKNDGASDDKTLWTELKLFF